jgi:hypothetical protein
MDRRTLRIFNATAIIVILAAAFFSWFYMQSQFAWGVVLITLLLLLTGYVNLTHKSHGRP